MRSPPNTVPDLFHSDNTFGILPFRVFPSLAAERLSAGRAPHDVSLLQRTAIHPPSGDLASSESVLTPKNPLEYSSGRSSHGLPPLQGFRSTCDDPRFITLVSPHALLVLPVRKHAIHDASGSQSQATQLLSFKSCRPS